MGTQSYREELDIDLQKYLLVLKRRWLPAVGILGAVTVLAALFALSREPTYSAEGKVLIKIDRTPSLTGVDTSGQNTVGKLDAIGLESDPIVTEVETINALPVAEAIITALDLKDEEGKSLSPVSFLETLKVEPIAGTDMIRISYQDKNPKLAAAIVNQLIETYRTNSIKTNQNEAVTARQFINEQLPATETAVRKAEAALRRFKEQNQVIALDEESQETVKAIQSLEDNIAQTKAQFATVSSQSKELQKRLGMSSQQAVSATALSQSPAIQEVFTQIRQVQGQLDLERARYRPTHPNIITLERQEAALQTRLQEEIAQTVGYRVRVTARGLQLGALEQNLTATLVQSEVERVSLASRIAELSKLQAAQRNRASVFPRLEATQRQLERQVSAAQSTYESLLQKLQETQIAENQTIDNVRVISQALVPEKPVSSGKTLILAGGFLAGAVLALIAAFAIDLSDRSLKTVREAGERLDYPILGVIPFCTLPFWNQSGKQRAVLRTVPTVFRGDDDQSAYMSHAYHMLQANLRFLSSDVGPRVVVVTSSVPQEGKSQVSANLAMAIAQAGGKVLLVDADLRQPVQHQIWECDNASGLAEVVAQKVALNTAVQAILPNLSLLTAGSSSFNSLAMLDAKQLISLVEAASRNYDIIIFDTPPLTWTADASILGNLADGTLLVVRPGKVDVADVEAAKGLLRLSGQCVLGMVVNGVEKTNKPSRYFAYNKDMAVASRKSMAVALSPALPTGQDFQNGKVIPPQETSVEIA